MLFSLGPTRSEMWILLTFMLILGVQNGWTAQVCDRDKGPSGTIECHKFRKFESQYQWATCLTSEHIQHKSNHTRICVDRTRTYCWFTCMGEVYGVSSGPVASDCSCDPYEFSPSTSLPDECYSPSGDNCYWYRNCLEKKYPPCKPSDNAYVIRYAEKFCRVVEEHKVRLSSDAQKWMEAVRKCQQVVIVPLLRLQTSPTCSEIRERALSSYSSCYLNPDNDLSSICDLYCLEHFKIFWSIKGTFPKLDTAWESLKGLWNIEPKCTLSRNEANAKCFQYNLKRVIKLLKLNTENLMRRKRRSSDSNSKDDVLSRFADGVGSAIASTLKWNTDVMDWFAYTANWVGLGSVDIVIVLADIKALGIVTAPIASIDFDQIIQDFASAVEKGTLRLQVDGYNVWLKTLSLCSNKSCDTTRRLAVSDKPPWNGANRISHGTVGLCGVIPLWIMLMDKMFF